jgi:hypothetical protein
MSDGIMFQSRNGIYLLTRGFEIVDIGFNIVDELSLHPNITSAVLVEGKNQVRFTCVNDRRSSCIILVYNYLFKAWTKWEVKDSRGVPIVMVDACIHDDVYYAITEDGDIWFEDETTSYDDSSYYPPLSFKSSHIQKAGQSGWQRTRSVIPFLQKEDTMCLHIKLYADFEDTPYKIVSLTDSDIEDFDNPEKRLQPKISVDRQKSQSIQIEIVDSQGVSSNAVRALGYTITGIQFDIGVKKGLVKTPSSQRV